MASLDELAEKSAKRIKYGDSLVGRLQDAALILLGFNIPHLMEGPKPKTRKEIQRVSVREGLSGLFNGWH